MSLVKSRTLTPALLAAKRRNALKSNGPRTARGKAQSRLNGLRHGGRSAAYHSLLNALGNAPPGAILRLAGPILPPEMARHTVLAELLEAARLAEIEMTADVHRAAESHRTRTTGIRSCEKIEKRLD